MAGMARTYRDEHAEWIISKCPGIDLSWSAKNFDIASRIVPFVAAQLEGVTLSLEEPNESEPYQILQEIENTLHRLVQLKLVEEFGVDNEQWWVRGVPLNVRVKCQTRREEDPRRDEPYTHTDLADLRAICDKNWRLFEPIFQKMSRYVEFSKNRFMTELDRLNEIRRLVMHPPRRESLTEDDLEFLRAFSDAIEALVSVVLEEAVDRDDDS